jgi:hypothetical protein
MIPPKIGDVHEHGEENRDRESAPVAAAARA